jgi:hypothetical protein
MKPGFTHFLSGVAIAWVAMLTARADWPQWRGPSGTGAAPQASPPLTWSETQNVRWKLPLAGRGHSSPVVARGRVFLTMAVPVGDAAPPIPPAHRPPRACALLWPRF